MAKKTIQPIASTSKLETTKPTAISKKRSSEIDDIFSAAPLVKKVKAVAASLNPALTIESTTTSSKNAKGKQKMVIDENIKKVIKTVMDPSAIIEAFRNNPAPSINSSSNANNANDEGTKKEKEEEERFMDSRGTARKFAPGWFVCYGSHHLFEDMTGRRTDDGFAIYSITELKIGLGGGELRSSVQVQ